MISDVRAAVAFLPSRRNGICLTSESSLLASSAFVPTSAQLKSVSTIPSENFLSRCACCIQSSSSSRWRIFPLPVRVTTALPADESLSTSSSASTPTVPSSCRVCIPCAAARTIA